MRTLMLAVVLSLSLLSQPSFAQQSSSAKALVERGLNAYLKDGANAAVQGWIKGSGLEGNTGALTQANTLRQVEDFYGKLESFDIVRENTLSPRSHIVFIVLNYTKGVLFGRFQAYQTKSGEWVMTDFKFNTDAAMVLPPEIVYGSQMK